MAAFTIRLSDNKHQRLKALAEKKHTSLNHLLDEAATKLLVESEAEMHFLLRAKRGEGKQDEGLELLSKAM